MDILIPETTEIETVGQIYKEDNTAIIVIVSAMGQEKIITDAIILGAKLFIVIPFKEIQVIETLNKIVKG